MDANEIIAEQNKKINNQKRTIQRWEHFYGSSRAKEKSARQKEEIQNLQNAIKGLHEQVEELKKFKEKNIELEKDNIELKEQIKKFINNSGGKQNV